MKRTKRSSTNKGSAALGTVEAALETIAPTKLAQEWDNVGLLAGDRGATIRRILLAIDLTRDVFEEARAGKTDLLIAYHPPIFKPIHRLTSPGTSMESLVWECVRAGIAIYSPHTALDAADGGTNDVLAEICGATSIEPLEYVDDPVIKDCKIVVFIPESNVDDVAEAMFAAGAGKIGDYSHCSFRLPGEGTFLGGESTNPTVGKKGRLERVPEVRLDMVAPQNKLPAILSAMRQVHPYEEPAFDVYPLRAWPVRGIGRIAALSEKTTVASLSRRLRKGTDAKNLQWVGEADRKVNRAVVVAGSAGSLPFRIPLRSTDVIVAGEIRHHDALTIKRHDCSAIAMGHWASERPVLQRLRERLMAELPKVTVAVSRADRDPFSPI